MKRIFSLMDFLPLRVRIGPIKVGIPTRICNGPRRRAANRWEGPAVSEILPSAPGAVLHVEVGAADGQMSVGRAGIEPLAVVGEGAGDQGGAGVVARRRDDGGG